MSNDLNNKSKFSLKLSRPNSPPTKGIICEKISSTLYIDQTNSNNYFSSNFNQYYSFADNLNSDSSGFSQNGGGHHNFYGRVDRLN